MTLVFGVLGLAVLDSAVWAFNRLVRLRNQVKAGWSDIDVQLMRRHDLVPRLVEAVRAYAGHEQAVLKRVTKLRAQAMATTSPARLAGLEQAIESDVARLLVIKEAYPELQGQRELPGAAA